MLNVFIKSFVISFVDIALTFSDSSFNSFPPSICLVSFEVTFVLEVFFLSTKSVFFTKLAISFLLAKCACANLAEKFSDINLLNY